jgi:hypothetical protein
MRHSNLRSLPALALAILVITLCSRVIAQIPGTTSAPAAPAAPAGTPDPNAAQQAPAAPPQICGNTAYCYESNDFAATITSFRITTDAAKRQILDLSIRFQNKTNQQLVLGYVNASGNASDDRGNRLVPWGPNASRGLGLVYGATFDPKFVVRPAGFGDAQLEFYPQGYPQVVGFTYTLDLSIAEINTFEGNQHTLGEEFPLHFQGLRNGSASVSPGFVPGAGFGQASGYAPGSVASGTSNPCATVGSLNQAAGQAAGQAATTVSNAATAISNLGSMFHRKKAQNAGQAATNVAGCDPNAAAAMPIPAAMTNATGAVANPLQQAVSRTAAPVAATNPLNPLASAPVKSVPATATKTAQTTPVRSSMASAANAQMAATPHNSATAASVNATKPAAPVAPVKPSPAKPAKPQTQAQKNAPANANSK